MPKEAIVLRHEELQPNEAMGKGKASQFTENTETQQQSSSPGELYIISTKLLQKSIHILDSSALEYSICTVCHTLSWWSGKKLCKI